MPFLEAGALPHMISILDWAHAAVWICVRTEAGKSSSRKGCWIVCGSGSFPGLPMPRTRKPSYFSSFCSSESSKPPAPMKSVCQRHLMLGQPFPRNPIVASPSCLTREATEWKPLSLVQGLTNQGTLEIRYGY